MSLYIAWLLPLFLSVSNVVETVESFWNKLTDILIELSQPKFYGFFKGSTYPYLLRMAHLYATGSAKLEHVFSFDDRCFFPYIENDEFAIERPNERPTSFPLLSLELFDPTENKVHYDLTDFVESVKVIHVKGSPSPSIAHILAAWQLISRVIVDTTRFKARYINNDGDSQEVDLTSTVPLFEEKTPETDSTLSSGSESPVFRA
jgi:hypothetical protein